jgi:hypothetical protein
LKDINHLVGNNLPIQIPPIVVRYGFTLAIALLHTFAFALAVLALFVGVLPILGKWLRSIFSWLAISITWIVTIIDLIVFYLLYKRINSLAVGGHAQLGLAIWLSIAASCLLFVSVILSACCL